MGAYSSDASEGSEGSENKESKEGKEYKDLDSCSLNARIQSEWMSMQNPVHTIQQPGPISIFSF